MGAMTDALPSLKWLQTFRTLAHNGSVQTTAAQSGMSVSAVSNQLQSLEKHLGIALMDHTRRPMVLTDQGAHYLRYVENVLDLLAEARGDITALAPDSLRHLRFAMIEDFENDIGPEITRLLASALPKCRLTHYTRVSHEILDLLRDGGLDIGIATQPQNPIANVQDIPLLKDPFVLVVPANTQATAEDFIQGQSGLPFLRYMRGQIIGGLIEAQLNRMRIKLEDGFELDSTASIMALVAQNSGWAITTPCSYGRSKRFHAEVRLLPFPRKGFARTISMFVAEQQAREVGLLVATAVRSRLATENLGPVIGAYPWLSDSFHLLDGSDTST